MHGRWLSVALGLLAYGVLIEILQGLTSYRHAEWADLLADGLGILAGLALFGLLRWLQTRYLLKPGDTP